MYNTYEVTGLIEGLDETPVVLGTALTSNEVFKLTNEYLNVYGHGNIIFNIRTISFKELNKERSKAFSKLFNSLNGPIHTVINQIKNK